MKNIILFLSMLIVSNFSFACTCVGKGNIRNAIKYSDAVFTGVVISSQKVEMKMDSLEVEKDSITF